MNGMEWKRMEYWMMGYICRLRVFFFFYRSEVFLLFEYTVCVCCVDYRSGSVHCYWILSYFILFYFLVAMWIFIF
jgi:hypothetical protein